MGKVMSVCFDENSTSIYNIQELNSSFATASIDIMYTGENRNGSDICRSVVEAALPTLYNVPVVCNYDAESREIGGHDFDIVADDDGNIRLRTLTVPCGVITDHTVFSFQNKKDADGVEHEYLVADGVVLWKRQEVFDYIANDCEGVVPHSMEINVTSGGVDKETGLYSVDSFEFTALCLLGNVSPCFEGSKLEVYSQANIKKDIAQMMSELKQYYSTLASAETDANQDKEGGDKMSDEIRQIIVEFGHDPDNLEFSVNGLSAEEVRAKFDAMSAQAETVVNDPVQSNEEGEATDTSENQKVFELNSNLYDCICKAVRTQTVSYEWGEEPKYWMRDFDVDKHEVYVEDSEDWNLYAFSYTIDGDDVVIDWDSKSRKKYAIVDYIEGERSDIAASASVFEERAKDYFSKLSETQAALSETEQSLASAESELAGLREFKENIEKEARSEQIEAVFALFADLSGNEMFDAFCDSVREGKVDLSPDDIEEKCFAIRGRVGMPSNFSASGAAPKLKVDESQAEESKKEDVPYGGIVEKYL